MQQTRTFKDKLLLVLKGLAMGAANKVPGVSGGVVAFVVGFYEEFIYSLQKINSKALLLLLNGRFRSLFTYINGRFLGLLMLGMVISYFSVSKMLDYLIMHFELYVWATFFGMIIGSIYYIGKDFRLKSAVNLLFIAIGITAGVAISMLEPATENDNLWFVFFCGIVGVSGMTLPGLSGSFILILIGNYVLLMVDSVNALYNAITAILRLDFSFMENPEQIRLLKVLTSFTLGSVVGLVTLSHILGYVLKHYKNITYATIIGFITGSLGVVWPWKEKIFKKNSAGNLLQDANGNRILDNYDRYIPEWTEPSTWLAILFILVGIAVVVGLGSYEDKNT
ncbi:DUF368 domain-containing protein [Haloflavibacter putidus]|uniref:DUF368 domain-containing protein n=1 Tax=Haloflavibacter putidus TaxID=2576776 RepID=A0A507ZN37_9FLAO|nr:DUF368 domain-containing protein [Haloflavibacter putidus]TQD36295.1 DUF368 domain-containing protein [Haloflavibacter putidus]